MLKKTPRRAAAPASAEARKTVRARRSKSDGNAGAIAKHNEITKAAVLRRLGYSPWQSRPLSLDAQSFESLFDSASEDWKAHFFLQGYITEGREQFLSGKREAEGRDALRRIISSAASYVPEGFRQPVPDLILRDLAAFFAQRKRRLQFKRVRPRSSEENFEMLAHSVKNEMASGKKWLNAVEDTAKFFHVGKTTIKEAWAKAKREMPELFDKPQSPPK
jgi:hypothetical protein